MNTIDNIREITSAKKAPLPVKVNVKVENKKIKANKKQTSSNQLQKQELKKLIASQFKSIAATIDDDLEINKSLWKKFSEYVALKTIVRIIVLGIITATGGGIMTFKTYQIMAYKNYIPNIILVRKSYNKMQDLCQFKNLSKDQKIKFNNEKINFDKNLDKLFNGDTYSFKNVLFGKEISLKETMLTDELMKINNLNLNDCSSFKINQNILLLKQKEIENDLIWSITLRWVPYLQFKKPDLDTKYIDYIDENILKNELNK